MQGQSGNLTSDPVIQSGNGQLTVENNECEEADVRPRPSPLAFPSAQRLPLSNVLVDDTGRARLADFGISSVSDPDIIAWTSQSSSASEGGTVRWQAPELFDVESDITGARNTVASDIYSCGCVFYEIFTGKIPFAHISNNFTVVVAVKSGSHPMRPDPSSPSWNLWGLTEDIWTCMDHCWSQSPLDRPSSAAVMKILSAGRSEDTRETVISVASAAEFRSRTSDMKANDVVTVEFLNQLLGDSQLSVENLASTLKPSTTAAGCQ